MVVKKKKPIARKDTSSKGKKVAKRKANPRKPKKGAAPKIRNAGTMSEYAFWSMIRSALRRKSMTSWKPIQVVREKAKIPYVGSNKRMKYSYLCSNCKKPYSGRQIAVHHLKECGSLTCYNDLPGFVERLFCEEEGLVLLCDKCHNLEHSK